MKKGKGRGGWEGGRHREILSQSISWSFRGGYSLCAMNILPNEFMADSRLKHSSSLSPEHGLLLLTVLSRLPPSPSSLWLSGSYFKLLCVFLLLSWKEIYTTSYWYIFPPGLRPWLSPFSGIIMRSNGNLLLSSKETHKTLRFVLLLCWYPASGLEISNTQFCQPSSCFLFDGHLLS